MDRWKRGSKPPWCTASCRAKEEKERQAAERAAATAAAAAEQHRAREKRFGFKKGSIVKHDEEARSMQPV